MLLLDLALKGCFVKTQTSPGRRLRVDNYCVDDRDAGMLDLLSISQLSLLLTGRLHRQLGINLNSYMLS